MPFDPNGLIESISNGLPRVPSALIAAALLGGPTAIWLIVRFTRPRDVPKKVVEVPETLLWLCTSCRSMNEDRVDRCYRCHIPREADDIPVVVHVGREAASRIGIQVGPAVPGREHGYGWLGGEFVVPTPDANEPVEAGGVAAPADFVAVVDSPAERTNAATIEPPVVAPIAAPVKPPIAAPVEPPIEPSIAAPVEPSIEPPIEPVDSRAQGEGFGPEIRLGPGAPTHARGSLRVRARRTRSGTRGPRGHRSGPAAEMIGSGSGRSSAD